MTEDVGMMASRFVVRLTASLLGLGLPALLCPPVNAAPSPRSEEWWFGAWQVEEKVWPLTQGKGVTVAVIDDGVQTRLPELQGVVLKGMAFAGESAGDGRTDEDSKNGGHGTAMAALIAAQGRGSGMVGIAPDSRIIPIIAAGLDVPRSIRYAVDHGAKVINISGGNDALTCPDGVQKAVAYAIEHDVITIAAAGNDGDAADSGIFPANCQGVLTVGAVDADLKPWIKSTPGHNVMVAAPGVAVGSIGKWGTFGWNDNGTSQATALTSGVVALMRSRFPDMSGRETVQRLLATAKDIPPGGWDKKTGYGAVIPYRALTAQIPRTSPNPVYERLDQARSNDDTAGIRSSKTREPTRQEEGQRYTCLALGIGGLIIATGLTFALHRKGLSRSSGE
ncbi:hypothetical protein E1293_40605 [Actinomadura darangshiensis]|uniref:Peptidase S8/S53 domain-containing protein n=1 Tax=Actinomadura darangshiensis TaxID=705336 RepID=A0A4R5A0A4_9ACTN|nr:S8 family serine peptidase [Actinomadura darangshiensis]TDD65178.1 hypothetical protein E1293_40605 [Actinomadura darangshiensis]